MNDTTSAPAQLLDKAAFAALCSVSKRSVSLWQAQGMPHFKTGPRKVLVDPVAAQAWMRARFAVTRKPSTSARARVQGGAR